MNTGHRYPPARLQSAIRLLGAWVTMLLAAIKERQQRVLATAERGSLSTEHAIWGAALVAGAGIVTGVIIAAIHKYSDQIH